MPVFAKNKVETEKRPAGLVLPWEDDVCAEETRVPSAENARRSINRAKVRAFDFIMANPDLDAFATLTIDGEKLCRNSWEEIYPKLRIWLSNRVTRRGLKYLLCPEYHKDGENIHFHMIANAQALQYRAALTPSGRPMYRAGKNVYNLTDWEWGFSTMQIVPPTDSRDAVAKYIFKYMGKNAGAKIAGRHFLHGGALREPYCEYADDISELPGVLDAEGKYRTAFSPCAGLDYEKIYFL